MEDLKHFRSDKEPKLCSSIKTTISFENPSPIKAIVADAVSQDEDSSSKAKFSKIESTRRSLKLIGGTSNQEVGDRFISKFFDVTKSLYNLKETIPTPKLQFKVPESQQVALNTIYNENLRTSLFSDIVRQVCTRSSFLGKRSPARENQSIEPKKVFFYNNQNDKNVYGTSRRTHIEDFFEKQKTVEILPLKILDVGEIQDDFYLNLMDWSPSNLIAISLPGGVFCWNSLTLNTNAIIRKRRPVSDITCVKFNQHGKSSLSLGTETGKIFSVDTLTNAATRYKMSHGSRISTICWRDSNIVFCGNREGTINVLDTRNKCSEIATLKGHSQEICSLRYSDQLSFLASGGNEDTVNIWDLRNCDKPFTSFKHNAAVKALDWNPHRRESLFSGGGFNDRKLKQTDIFSNRLVSEKDLKCQITGIICSDIEEKLVTIHGYPSNNMALWDSKNMSLLAEFEGHRHRILHYCSSPEGERIATGSADTRVKIWKCFGNKRSQRTDSRSSSISKFHFNLR